MEGNLEYKLTEKMLQLLVGKSTANYLNMKVKQVLEYQISNSYLSLKDYKKGFGGQFGVQTDRKDKSAVGWEEHEKVAKHESQTG